MAKKRLTPLKDEPMTSFDEVCSKLDELVAVINQQNGCLQQIAKQDSHSNTVNEISISKTVSDAVEKCFKEHNAKVSLNGEVDTALAKVRQLVADYRTAIQDAKDAVSRDYSGGTQEISLDTRTAALSVIEKPQRPQSIKGMFTYLFYRMPWYYLQRFFASPCVRWCIRGFLFWVWITSIFLTCFIAYDNARLRTVQKKYVLLREFARTDKEWVTKADYIEFIYTDETEHQKEIDRLWENRRNRLEN